MKNRLYILIITFIAASQICYTQVSRVDSLISVIPNIHEDTVKVNILLELSASLAASDSTEAIRYANEAIVLGNKLDFQKGIAYAYKNIGLTYYFVGNYIDAANNWQQALDIFRSIEHKQGEANILNNLGAINNNEGDDSKALELYLESLDVSEEIGDKVRIYTALQNIGLIYGKKDATFDKALEYYFRALPISEELDDHYDIGHITGNIGEIYFKLGNDTLALDYFERCLEAFKQDPNGNIPFAMTYIGKVHSKRGNFDLAIQQQMEAFRIAEKTAAKVGMAQACLGLADTYVRKKDIKAAVSAFNQAKIIAEKIGLDYELQEAYRGLAKSYAEKSDYYSAYKNQELLTNINDSLYQKSNEKRIAITNLNFNIVQQQGEIELQELTIKNQKIAKNASLAGLILILIIAFIIFRNYLQKVKINKILDKQKDEIEGLLLNILPAEVAEELQTSGYATPRHYQTVSVLFTDFKGFTKIAEGLTPNELVNELNIFFKAFDNIVQKYKLEKIKTIGDAYMCAGGIPSEDDTHVYNIIRAGLAIQDCVNEINVEREKTGELPWQLRLGINTGPIIAGVVGIKKYAYDIWGDTVNIAARMESSGEVGKVNISESTYKMVKDKFICHHRGKISAKNKGEIDMYFVESEIIETT
ncbi:adenylate/guanylate cyclase domain-containing protein [Bacteroidota bacterium]